MTTSESAKSYERYFCLVGFWHYYKIVQEEKKDLSISFFKIINFRAIVGWRKNFQKSKVLHILDSPSIRKLNSSRCVSNAV